MAQISSNTSFIPAHAVSFGPNQQNMPAYASNWTFYDFLTKHAERKVTEDFKAFS